MRAERLALQSDACAGKAAHEQLLLHLALPDGDFAFPLHLVTPYAPAKALLLHLSFDPEMPNQYCLAEEIVDHGYAICQLCYTQVTSDDQDGENGLAAHFIGKDFAGRKTSKISLWAFAASRVIDYLKTLEPLKNLPGRAHRPFPSGQDRPLVLGQRPAGGRVLRQRIRLHGGGAEPRQAGRDRGRHLPGLPPLVRARLRALCRPGGEHAL